MKRARVELCMISTPDGVIDVGGRSGPLGGPADQARLAELRAAADVVLVGAGTVRAENYGAPSRSDLRIAVVTRSCALDFDTPLFTSGSGLVVTTVDAPDVPVESVREGTGQVDLESAIARLDAGLVHVEGGPQLNAALLDADLVDAINLTISPMLFGVNGPSWTMAPHATREFVLAWTQERDGMLFARWERVRSA
ncbi:MAG: dihydrofolate reductase family protein [Actinomycetota bacterium]